MNKSFNTRILGVIVALFCVAGAAHAQGEGVAEREAEWQGYKVPSVNYVRHVVEGKAPGTPKSDSAMSTGPMLFWVPAAWREAPSFTFNGPEGAYLRVVTETIPDGIPLSQYAISVLQSLQDLAGGTDSVVVRRTRLAGDEGREIVLDLPDARGVSQRRALWITVQGPTAVLFVFVTPLAKAAELEPYFKGVVQSANIPHNIFDFAEYETLRRGIINEDKPERIDQLLALAGVVDGPNTQARSQATSKLRSLLSESPGAMLDLVLDRRPAVRGAAIDAIAASDSKIYDKVLLRGVKDGDVLVAERAAKVLASRPDVLAMLREETRDWHEDEVLFRVWPFLDDKPRRQVVNEIFTRQNFKPSSAGPGSGSPPAASQGTASKGKSARTARGNTGVVTVWADSSPEYNRLFSALSLLRDIPVSEQKIPLEEIAASGYDLLIAPALQVGLDRQERFSVDTLLKLLSSPSATVGRLAAWNLALSGATSDIPRIEEAAERLSTLSPPKPEAKPDAKAGSKEYAQSEKLPGELRATVKKIRLRDQLANASGAARAKAIREGMEDGEIADWVWRQYEREQDEGAGRRSGRESSSPNGKMGSGAVLPADRPSTGATDANKEAQPSDLAGGAGAKPVAIAAMGENVFPPRLTLYAAMPNPSATFKKLGDSLTGLQMDTASDQALFVLMLSSFKTQLARTLGGDTDQPLLGNTGIDLNAPIVAGKWTAEGAPQGLKAAQRKAVIMRVSDPERFERLLGIYQMHIGGFSKFTEGLSLASRFVGLLPALVPSVAAFMKNGPGAAKESPAYKYVFRRTDQTLGHSVTVIERRQANSEGEVETDSIYLTYVGNEAVIAPDWVSLRDALAAAGNGKSALADNPEYKREAGKGGDVIYLSDLTAAFGGALASGNQRVAIVEGGALNISNTAWSNSYRLSIPEAWSKPLLAFQPGAHAGATELLPSSTVIYLLMKVDALSIWRGLRMAMPFDGGTIKKLSSAWAVDFEKEVLPELGPECGAALLGVPNLDSKFGAPWVIFFKLKSGRLAEAMRQGRLIKNSSAGSEIQHMKLGPTDVAVEIKSGFLIFGANEAALQRLESPERLKSAHDFVRAANKAPSNVVAFGGYNLEAATAELKDDSGDYRTEAVTRVLKSLVRAFHSQNFYITADGQALDAHMSVSLDREGRYSVADLASMSKDFRPTYGIIEARGAPISEQQLLSGLTLKIRVKAAGAIDRIAEDLRTEYQSVDKTPEGDLVVKVKQRRLESTAQVKLPIADKQFAQWLAPTQRIKSDDKDVVARAREIAGGDIDAWSVARKLSDWIYKNLKWRVVDPGDAAHTLATREAACLEFSELYVALARSLGLPARIATGLAYTDGSFGGHAWVEVYTGQWIEIDPTWGTNFVDATHLRQTTDDLTTYAALNLASIEVIEAPRLVADFQRDPASLVRKLCEELPRGISSALRVAIDIAGLTDKLMGAGTWARLGDREREQMSSAYQRLIATLSRGQGTFRDIRVLKINQDGGRADALVMAPAYVGERPWRIGLERKGDAWIITDLLEIDSDFHILAENMRPAAERIAAQRAGKRGDMNALSIRGRIAVLFGEDPKAALELVDRELENEPRSVPLRHLKAMCLRRLNRRDEAVKLWTQLSDENPPFAPALLELAGHYAVGENKDPKRTIQLYERYAAAVPDDPRPHESLGDLYQGEGDMTHAEAEFRAMLERDPNNPDSYDDLARVLALEHHHAEAIAVLDQGARQGDAIEVLFASLLMELDESKHGDIAEELAAAQPQRMAKSARANLNLAYIRVNAGRPRESLPLLKKALELDPKSGETYDEMAVAYRKLQEWRSALAAADAAIRLGEEDLDAHYNRACALARLGRLNESFKALKRSVELDEDEALDFASEEDLKPLARMPAFKKLLSDRQEKEGKDKAK